jgi:putative flippase GtrA
MWNSLVARFGRFVITGGCATAISYIVFTWSLSFTNYPTASFFSWIAGIPVGFALNRAFTFRIFQRKFALEQFVRFSAGAIAMLLINEACLFLFIGQLHMQKTVAFVLTLTITATLNFIYLSVFAFRKR